MTFVLFWTETQKVTIDIKGINTLDLFTQAITSNIIIYVRGINKARLGLFFRYNLWFLLETVSRISRFVFIFQSIYVHLLYICSTITIFKTKMSKHLHFLYLGHHTL